MRSQRFFRSYPIATAITALGLCTALADWAATFSFSDVNSFGIDGLSQPFAGATSSGQSYARGVSISESDTSQNIYSLVQASPDGTSGYQGPYYIVRRLSNGNIDTSFGASGYVISFPQSSNSSYQFSGLCIDPGTSNLVVVGNANNGSNTAVVERLLPPAAGSGTAAADTSFGNSGVVTVTPAGGNSNPEFKSCSVSNDGAGNNGEIYAFGDDDAYPQTCTGNCSASSGLLLVAKIGGDGSMKTSFGSDGITEITVSSGGTSLIPEASNFAGNGNQSSFADIIIAGDAYPSGNENGQVAMAVALDRCSGALDNNFNGTGELVDPSYDGSSYSTALIGRITQSGGAADNLYLLFGTANNGTYTGDFVQFPITGAVPDTSSPTTQPGTISFPGGFQPNRYTSNASGQIVFAGDTSSNAELLAELGGSGAIGYTPSSTAGSATCSSSGSTTGSTSGGSTTGGTTGGSSGGGTSGGDTGGSGGTTGGSATSGGGTSTTTGGTSNGSTTGGGSGGSGTGSLDPAGVAALSLLLMWRRKQRRL